VDQPHTKTADGRSETDKPPNTEQFLGNIGLNIVTDDLSDTLQVVGVVTGDENNQRFTKQSNLYHRQNADKWKISSKSLK
jgi:hypothetical protein